MLYAESYYSVLSRERSITERVDVWNVTEVYFVYKRVKKVKHSICLLYTSDAADE